MAPQLDQIVYLLYPTLIGTANYSEFELVDVGSRERAERLQGTGIGLMVADALAYAEYLNDIRQDGDDFPVYQQFLNRVRSFPLDWRTPEWEKLVEKLNVSEGIPLTVNVSAKGASVDSGTVGGFQGPFSPNPA